MPGVNGRKDAPLLRRVVRIFAGETGDALERAARHADAGDWDEVRAIAHRTKSAAASVGATRLAALATELDALIRGGRIDTVASLPARMLAAYREYLRALERERLLDDAPVAEPDRSR